MLKLVNGILGFAWACALYALASGEIAQYPSDLKVWVLSIFVCLVGFTVYAVVDQALARES